MKNGKCALPPHLRDRKHNDWIWPLSKISRGYNAFGSRCDTNSSHYLSWPPYLIKGFGVARWENTGATSILDIPLFRNIYIDSSVYGRTVFAYEKNPDSPNHDKLIEVKLNWSPAKVWDEEEGGKWVQKCSPNDYHPSALQSYSPKGWMKLKPDYYAWWRRIDVDKVEPCPNLRRGYRPDSLDGYYNKSILYVGLNYE